MAHTKLNLLRGGSYALKCVRKSKVVGSNTEYIHLQTEVSDRLDENTGPIKGCPSGSKAVNTVAPGICGYTKAELTSASTRGLWRQNLN